MKHRENVSCDSKQEVDVLPEKGRHGTTPPDNASDKTTYQLNKHKP